MFIILELFLLEKKPNLNMFSKVVTLLIGVGGANSLSASPSVHSPRSPDAGNLLGSRFSFFCYFQDN